MKSLSGTLITAAGDNSNNNKNKRKHEGVPLQI